MRESTLEEELTEGGGVGGEGGGGPAGIGFGEEGVDEGFTENLEDAEFEEGEDYVEELLVGLAIVCRRGMVWVLRVGRWKVGR